MFRLYLCSALLSVVFVGCDKKRVADEQQTEDSADALPTEKPASETTTVVDPLTVTKTEVTEHNNLRITLKVAEGVITEAKCEVLTPPVAGKAPMVDSSATGTMLMRLSCKDGDEQDYLNTEPGEPDCFHPELDDCNPGDEDCECEYDYDCYDGECPREVAIVAGVATLFSQDNSYDISESVSIDGNCLRLHIDYDHDANPATAVKQVTGRVLLEEHDSL